MGFVETFLIGVGLSMDALAVSVGKGLVAKRKSYRDALLLGIFFGGFQALMPFLGWWLGSAFAGFITQWDHWIAFILLFIIGANMIRESFNEEAEEDDGSLEIKELFLLAIATSIDALAVGVSFAFLDVNIWTSIAIIGTTTFVISFLGYCLGKRLGTKFEKHAGQVGGAVLILIGLKILLEGLGLL